MLKDFRLAARSLVKHPAFSLTAFAVLALGIGANAAVFGLVNQALFSPPGISDPSRVVAIRASYAKLNLASIPVSGPDYRDVRSARDVFERTAAMQGDTVSYGGAGNARTLQAAIVSREWFDVFGARPALGRTFTAEEDQPNAAPTVILSHAAWVRLFGSDATIVGRTIVLDEKPHRVVGIMPASFRWPREVEVWRPLALPQAEVTGEDYRFNEHMTCVARTREGIGIDGANARVATLAARVKSGSDRAAAYAREANWGMFAMPFTEFVAGDSRRPMLVLLGAVGFVLLIACANIAGLMVARTTSRGREIAVRSALGAQRWQLLRELLAESLLLAGGGVLAGVLVAAGGMRLLLASAPEGAVVGLAPRLDAGVLVFALAAALISAALFAVAPAWQISRSAVFEQLKASGRSATAGRGRQRLRAALVVAETGLAVLLLIGAGLLIRSFSRIQDVNPGFEPRGVITGGVGLPATRYEEPARRETFYRTLIERLDAMPGVVSAAAAVSLPFVGSDNSASFQIEGLALGPGDPGPHGRSRYVTPEYFTTLRIPLKRGRTFTADDRLGAAPVVVIDENLAARYWPGQDPVGKRMRQGQAGTWSTVVGVVGHVLHNELVGETDKGTFYRPFYQRPNFDASVVVRVRGDVAGSMGVIAQAVAGIDGSLPVQRVTSLGDRVAASLAPRRFAMRVLSFFAIVALVMAALGLYGVISYSVAQRTQEIGIRMALGATPGSVVGSVLAQGVGLAAAGLAVGLVAALAAGRVLSGQLYQVSAFDPVTLGVMVPVLLGAAVFASWLPARAASRVDPLVALREE